jgi:hypothetical protein
MHHERLGSAQSSKNPLRSIVISLEFRIEKRDKNQGSVVQIRRSEKTGQGRKNGAIRRGRTHTLKNLNPREVDVVISDNIVGAVLLRTEQYRDSRIRQIERPLDSALLFTYLHKKHADLVPDLAEAIRRAKCDGTCQRIVGELPPYD